MTWARPKSKENSALTTIANLPDLAFGEDRATISLDAKAMTETISRSVPAINIIDPSSRHGGDQGFYNKSVSLSIGTLNLLASASTACIYDIGANDSNIQITIPFYGEAETHIGGEKCRIKAHETGSILGHYRRAVGFHGAINSLIISPCGGKLNAVAKTMRAAGESSQTDLCLDRTRELNLRRKGYSISAYFMALSRLVNDLIEHPQVLDKISFDDLIYRQLVMLLVPETPAESDRNKAADTIDHAFDMICDQSLARLDKPLTRTEMEKLSGLDAKSFAKQFRLRFGCSAMEWQRRERLEIARKRLLNGDKVISIAQLSTDTGFMNAKSFSAHYRRQFHERPDETLWNRHVLRSGFRNYLQASAIPYAS